MSGTPRCCNTLRSTPLGNLDPVIRLFEGIFLTASANLIRNREFHVDYLGHAHRPDGQLNDRAWAEAQVADALPALVGRAWVRVVNHLRTPESFTFLDRKHDALALIPVRQELRDALVRLWWLRRQRPAKSVVGPVRGAGHVAH